MYTYIVAGEDSGAGGVSLHLLVVHLEVARPKGPVHIVRLPVQHHAPISHLDGANGADRRRKLRRPLLHAGEDLPDVGDALDEVRPGGGLVDGLAERLAGLGDAAAGAAGQVVAPAHRAAHHLAEVVGADGGQGLHVGHLGVVGAEGKACRGVQQAKLTMIFVGGGGGVVWPLQSLC
jgi:hypothetical protein